MSRRLRDNITSGYIEAANRLKPKTARRRIVAYVESYDDIFFWRSVLGPLETDKMYFEIMLPSHDRRLERGKKAVIMNLHDKVGEDMIACVDADYDYLIQGATSTSQEVIGNRYIFHTYAYAIENLQCYAPSLQAVCVAATLNDRRLFDIEEFMRQFSVAIYPLFVWNIWYYRSLRYSEFTLTDFLRVIEMGHITLGDAEALLQRLRQKVDRRVRQLQGHNPDARQSWQQLKSDLQQLGVTPESTYLYIQGHYLFNKIVVPLLSKVCEQLQRDREKEIDRQSVHGTQRRNELSCYRNSLTDLSALLKKNLGYLQSAQVKRIQADVQAVVVKSEKS